MIDAMQEVPLDSLAAKVFATGDDPFTDEITLAEVGDTGAEDPYEDVDPEFRQQVAEIDFGKITAEMAAIVMQKICKIEAHIKATEMEAKAQIDLINRQAQAINKAERRKREYLESFCLTPMEAFLRMEIAGKKGKSYKTLFGTLALRKAKDSFSVVDEDVAKAFAKEHVPEAITVVVQEKLQKEVLKKHLLDTGELPEGCEFTIGEDEFSLNVKFDNFANGV